jgi:hypothetical protein
VLYDALR